MIGMLRERISIQRLTETPDSVGEPIKSWALLATVWARAKYLAGRELTDASKINEEIRLEFTVRYRADINEKMRVSWRSKAWNIHALLPDEQKVWMRILASEVT